MTLFSSAEFFGFVLMDSGYLWYVVAIPVNIGSPSEVHKSYWLGSKQKCNQRFLTDLKNVKTAVKKFKKVVFSLP